MTDETPKSAPETRPDDKPEAQPVVTHHELEAGGELLKYTATVGMMPLKNAETGDKEADIFFMAYTLDEPTSGAARPLTFVFNGGPGSASIWLHLGALGPQRVLMNGEDGFMPAPPYRRVDNPHTWLDQTDLVFIDPVGTGFSRAAKPDLNKKFWSVEGDLAAVGEFIRLYLTRYSRWSSPLFLAGESYGTTRAAGLAGHLIDRGIALNGIVMISTVMNFQTLAFDRGNDLPFALYIPTYAATAWYHHKLSPEYQGRPLESLLAEVEAWALGEYTTALTRGDALADDDRARIIAQLAAYTGLDEAYLDQTHLRIDIMRFCKQLLRDQKRTIGRLDSRFQGVDADAAGETFEFDPSLTAITPPYTAVLNDYVRRALRYETDLVYHTLSFEVNRGWDRGAARYTDTSEALRSAFAKNPYMRLLVTQGYYDLATPHLAAQYTLAHMNLPAAAREQIAIRYYEAGHMFYLHTGALARFREDVRAFIGEAIAQG